MLHIKDAGLTDHDEARVHVVYAESINLEIVVTHEGVIVNQMDSNNEEILESRWETWTDIMESLH